MKSISKKSFFNEFFSKGLYVQGLKLSKVAGLGFLVITLFVNAVWIIVSAWSSSPNTTTIITGGNIAPLYFLVFISGAITSYDLFSFHRKRKNSDFFNSIPQTRLCVFLSFTASILTWIILTLAITFLSCSLIWSAFENYSVDWSALFPMISGAFCSCAVFSGIVVLCILFSGTASAFAAYLVSLLVAPRIIINVVIHFINQTQSTVIAEFTWLKYFIGAEYSYIYPILNFSKNQTGHFEKPAFIFSLLIEAFILFAISGVLFVRRKSEDTEKPYVYKPVHIILRASVILSILAATIAVEEIDFFVVGVTVILHFIYDLVSLKSAKKSVKSLGWYLLPVGLCFVLLGAGILAGEAFEFFSPNKKSTTAISVYSNEYDGILLTWFECNEINYKLWTTDEESINVALNALEEGKKSGGRLWNDYEFEAENSILIKFKNKNGKESLRKIPLSEQDYISILKGIKSEEENKKILSLPDLNEMKTPELFVYSSKEALTKEIYDQFAEEYNALSPEKQVESELYYNKIFIKFYLNEKVYCFHLDRESFPKTTKLIYDSPEHNSIESANFFKEQIKAIKDSTDDGKYLSVISATKDEHMRVYISNSVLWDNFYNALDADALSDTSDINKRYYVKLEDKYYFFSLDENLLAILREME